MNVCPTCASDQIQRAEVAWSLGTKTTNQTVLAAAIGPPARKTAGGAVAIAALGVLIGLLAFLMGLGGDGSAAAVLGFVAAALFAPAMAAVASASQYNHGPYLGLYREWQTQWVCLQCGCLFKVNRLDGAPTEDQPLPTVRHGPEPPFRQSSPHLP